jgi:extracellular factor (EF) 3-hydroxypalmitic acid methyl ester biosynthesis protein
MLGKGRKTEAARLIKQASQDLRMATRNGELNSIHSSHGESQDSMILCQTSQGVEIHASVLRLTRFLAVFEIYSPALVLRTSEVLSDFKVVLRDRTIYSGRAVVRSLVSAAMLTVCEVTLDENSWRDVEFAAEMIQNGRLRGEFQNFMQEWQKLYKILPEFKVVIADMQSFFSDLRLWLEQVELGVRSSPSGGRESLEKGVVEQLKESVVPIINELFDHFEASASHVDEELQPAHRLFGKRQLHPFLLASPFVYRTFTKPLGYAGDYEVVNMMFRDPCEGGSLFAKMINAYALQLPPIIAHRNRISYLCDRLVEEARRVAPTGKPLRVYNLGCGPAQEIQQFLAREALSSQSEFVLADFNDETLAHVESVLSDLKKRYGRRTGIRVIKQTAHQLIKQSERSVQYPEAEQYHMIYCAGLFDYLSDKVCRKLMNLFYDMLLPGGLLLATNVDGHPSQNEMEYFLEWHLIDRNTREMLSLAPERVERSNVWAVREPAGVNILLHVKKSARER